MIWGYHYFWVAGPLAKKAELVTAMQELKQKELKDDPVEVGDYRGILPQMLLFQDFLGR